MMGKKTTTQEKGYAKIGTSEHVTKMMGISEAIQSGFTPAIIVSAWLDATMTTKREGV